MANNAIGLHWGKCLGIFVSQATHVSMSVMRTATVRQGNTFVTVLLATSASTQLFRYILHEATLFELKV